MGTEQAGDARQGIQSVENAMTVLLALERGAGPMTLTQIAEGSGMQLSKAHRYLVSLSRVRLVSQSPRSGLYDLGPAIRRLGAESLRRMDEVGVASEYLPGLRDRTKHTVGLHVWGEHGPVLVRGETGAYLLPMTVRIGTTLPLLTTSAGQVYLAHLPATLTEPVREANPDGQQAISGEDLERIKEEVHRNGFAVTTDAVLPGVTALAAPVFATEGLLPLVVVILMPKRQATPSALRTVSAELLKTAEAISAELGYVSKP